MKTLLLQNESDSTLKQLMEFAKKLGIKTNLVDDNDWWGDLSKDEQEEIKLGLFQAENGELVNQEKVMQRFTKWH